MTPRNRIWLVMTILLPILLTGCGTGSVLNETWTMTKLVTVGEDTDTVPETVVIRNCGIPEEKVTDCSAGTTKDLSLSFSGGGQIGIGAGINLSGSVQSGLGIGRSSGESLTLPVPPEGSIYEIDVVKEYKIKSGIMLAHSESGAEQDVSYNFMASCSIQTIEKRIESCDGTSSESAVEIEPENTTSTSVSVLPNGSPVSPDSLADLLGGEAQYWTNRGPDVWGYWNKGGNVTFRHPGGGSILTYWSGFPEPRNASDCQSIIVQAEDTRYVKCPNGTKAAFESDGVGFHLIDHTGYFGP